MKPGPVPGQVFAARETLAVDYRLVISVEFESKCSTIKTSNLEKRYQNSFFLGLAKIHKLQLFLPLPTLPPPFSTSTAPRYPPPPPLSCLALNVILMETLGDHFLHLRRRGARWDPFLELENTQQRRFHLSR